MAVDYSNLGKAMGLKGGPGISEWDFPECVQSTVFWVTRGIALENSLPRAF